jgi:(1->4)-alpha-D-glucan 1-alpha-D-glucosylmutase
MTDNIPIATYRLQFGPEFGFSESAEIFPYLCELGISHVYASPIFQARHGSTHGYDGVDPNALSADLGAPDAWTTLVETLRRHNMQWLQDIVPNHMAYHADNRMLADVFENGSFSPFYRSFDICWDHPVEGLKDRVMAPFLGRRYTECLKDGEIRLVYGAEGFQAAYFDWQFPLRIDTYLDILDHDATAIEAELGQAAPDTMRWMDLLDRLESLPMQVEPTARDDHGRTAKQILWDLYRTNGAVRAFIAGKLQDYNADPGDINRFRSLDTLLSKQWFRLCYWQDANAEINYRRFFDINGLIALRQASDVVFQHTHALLARLVAEGIVSGVRIDHIDGLADPGEYLRRLRRCLGEPATILVEKILAPDEALPSDWPVQGTTGYDFSHWLNAVFVRRENAARFDEITMRFSGLTDTFAEVVRASKKTMLASRLAGDLDNLARRIKKISAEMCFADNLPLTRLKSALAEVLAQFPVYRTYLGAKEIGQADREVLDWAISRSIQAQPRLTREIVFIRDLFLKKVPPALAHGDASIHAQRRQAVRSFQQLSATLMAKGVEDTAFYRYHRLVSLNDVGGEPGRFGCSVDQFHTFVGRRAARWPRAMNSTATHDAKRGEDVRARLNVLSEIPSQWQAQLDTWHTLAREVRIRVGAKWVPDKNTELLFYQTLLGIWPTDDTPTARFGERIRDFMIKAAREAGQHTSWIDPCQAYESALSTFVAAVLNASAPHGFMAACAPFCKKIAFFGLFNSLSQCLLKITAPGIPDFYQGTERMQFDLVDPDNRRLVDYAKRRQRLKAIRNDPRPPLQRIAELLVQRRAGTLKQFLIARALEIRRDRQRLFQSGDYLPLQVEGRFRRHLVAFARKAGDAWCVVMAPRFVTDLVDPPRNPVGRSVWRDTRVSLPEGSPRNWQNGLTGQGLQAGAQLSVGEAMAHFPVALLLGGATS